MKSAWQIILLVGSVQFLIASIASQGGLWQDVEDIRRVIPTEQLNEVFQDYINNDEEVMVIFKYLTSGDHGEAWMAMAREPGVQELFEWVNAHSSPTAAAEEGDPEELEVVPSGPFHFNRTGGWKGFIRDYYSIYPGAEVSGLISQKVAEGGLFAEFWQKVREMKNAYERILTLPEVVKVVRHLSALGVDVEELDAIVRGLLGWS